MVYLLVFHAYINEMHSSRSKIPSKKSCPRIYDVKFLALLGAPYIYDIIRLRVNLFCVFALHVSGSHTAHHQEATCKMCQMAIVSLNIDCPVGQDEAEPVPLHPDPYDSRHFVFVVFSSPSSSVWGRRLPTECTAAYPCLLY
jgi:hypothetical protein